MIPVYNINSTQEQIMLAIQEQSALFAPGIVATVASAANVTQLQQYNQNIVQNGYVQPDSVTGGGLYTGVNSMFNGQPVYANLDISGGSYTYPDGQGNSITYTYPSIRIDTVLFTVTQEKLIVRTAVQGLAGTIKEYISQGDFRVKISGVIPSTNGVYPLQTVTTLRNIFIAPVAFQINSAFLKIFGINNLVIENAEFPMGIGSYSYQAFTLDCWSDKPVPITINQSF